MRPAECAEIDGGPADDLPDFVNDDAESAIAVLERQPVKPCVLANALFALGRNLAGPKQDHDAIGLDIEACGDDRRFDLLGVAWI